MISLTPHECRALGVLVEKAMTTPDQYPLTLNALTAGCNQKNNRYPVLSLDANDALEAVNGLRGKGLVVQVDAGGRVPKYRQEMREKLSLNAQEAAIMAELLLRGPQTMGELRGRASRMYLLADLEVAQNVLAQLMGKPEPLVQRLPPAPGSRAERYAQLLCPDLHPLDAAPMPESASGDEGASPGLGERVTQLEAEVASLKQALQKLAAAVGEPDPTVNT